MKHQAHLESLRRQYSDPINTAEKLFEWADTKLDKIKVFFVNKDQVKETKLMLKNRFDRAKRINGTMSFHSYVPKDLKSIYVSRTSSGQNFKDLRKIC